MVLGWVYLSNKSFSNSHLASVVPRDLSCF